jgi:hypothetical protein
MFLDGPSLPCQAARRSICVRSLGGLLNFFSPHLATAAGAVGTRGGIPNGACATWAPSRYAALDQVRHAWTRKESTRAAVPRALGSPGFLFVSIPGVSPSHWRRALQRSQTRPMEQALYPPPSQYSQLQGFREREMSPRTKQKVRIFVLVERMQLDWALGQPKAA